MDIVLLDCFRTSDSGYVSCFPRSGRMSLDRWFGLSVYLTLGLSCVALVFAETFFLPGLQICLAPVLALLLLAWWFEGRWCLPTWGANVLGLVIAAGAAAVLATQWTDSDSWVSRVPWSSPCCRTPARC